MNTDTFSQSDAINAYAHNYFSTHMRYAQLLRNGFAGFTVFFTICICIERAVEFETYWDMSRKGFWYSLISFVLYNIRYIILYDIYDKVQIPRNKQLVYYMDIGKHLYDPSTYNSPFLDDMCIAHMMFPTLLCVLGVVDIINWINKVKYSFGCITLLLPIVTFMILDYIAWKQIIGITCNKTRSFSRWVKLNYRIDINFDFVNIKPVTFHAPINLVEKINESLKKVTEDGK